MIINYVPGLALRFFPGLSREPNDAVEDYIASNTKIAIFTGTAPTEQTLWNLTNLEEYITANADKLVYQETTQLKFSYDGFKHKRVIQRWPVDSTNITILNDKVLQDLESVPAGEDVISTPNDLYALVYCPDKDVTLNTTGNDLIFLLPNVGSGSTDFCSLSTTDFAKDSEIYFRNLTVALFQGYQITDTLITEEQEDPENPGEMINVPIDTKKSVYINKVWGTRVSEAYRDCFVSRPIIGTKYNYVNSYGPYPPVGVGTISKTSAATTADYMQDFYHFNGGPQPQIFLIREYDPIEQTWKTNNILGQNMNSQIFNGFLINQAVIDLIDEINTRSILGSLPPQNDIIAWNIFSYSTPTHDSHRFNFTAAIELRLSNTQNFMDLLPGLLVKYLIHQSWYSETLKVSYKQLMLELGFDESLIDRAIKSMVQLNLDITKWNSSFDKDNNILTLQNNEPIRLKDRYKKSIQNPTNEALYILLPRYMIRSNFENPYPIVTNPSNSTTIIAGNYSSISSVSFPRTTRVLEGDNVDNFTQRVRINDYTAISIGQTGNGKTDLEYDLIDIIDYIDSLTVMVKIPNKF